jgi:hypothetical protein
VCLTFAEASWGTVACVCTDHSIFLAVPESVQSQTKIYQPDTDTLLHQSGGEEDVHELQSNSDEIDPDDPFLDPVPSISRQPSPGKEAPSTLAELPSADVGVQPPPAPEEFDPELFEIEGSTTVFCEFCCPLCFRKDMTLMPLV